MIVKGTSNFMANLEPGTMKKRTGLSRHSVDLPFVSQCTMQHRFITSSVSSVTVMSSLHASWNPTGWFEGERGSEQAHIHTHTHMHTENSRTNNKRTTPPTPQNSACCSSSNPHSCWCCYIPKLVPDIHTAMALDISHLPFWSVQECSGRPHS